MASTDKDVRARSFGALADAYHAHRPDYPDAALAWALDGTPPAADLLDLGAGTGKLTASLVRRGGGDGTVHAVEPDPGMLAVLRATLPGAHPRVGSAEAIPLPDGSVDAVLVGQALHWFDPERAYPEIARVLRPGGVLTALWNHEDQSVDWVRGYYELVRGTEATGVGPDRTPAAQRTGLENHPSFDRLEIQVFDNPIPMTIDGLLDSLGTFSWISTLADAERADTLTRGRAYLEARPETGPGSFVLPLRTTVVRTYRRA